MKRDGHSSLLLETAAMFPQYEKQGEGKKEERHCKDRLVIQLNLTWNSSSWGELRRFYKRNSNNELWWYLLTCLLTYYLLTYLLTHSMVQDIISKADSRSACHTIACFLYGYGRFITVFTKARHWDLSWFSRIQFAPSIPIPLTSTLMLFSYLRLGLPSGLFPSALTTKTL